MYQVLQSRDYDRAGVLAEYGIIKYRDSVVMYLVCVLYLRGSLLKTIGG